MRVLLAGPRGFCAGVNMAIESLERALERFGTPLYVYHEIVHNASVVERFTRRGVVFVDAIEDVPPGAHLLYSAHGVSPEIRRRAAERGLHTVDATCPLVTKVHDEAIRYASEGYEIVLIGHEGHDEVVGTMGEVPGAIHLVGSADDVDSLELDATKQVAYLTQTTLSLTDAERIVGRLRQRFPDLIGPAKGDICYATQNRQEAVADLTAEADLAIVVGSRNSSNSRRLRELAESGGIPAYLVDGPDDMSPAWFEAVETVLVTAGASAPEDIVEGCVRFLTERFGATVESRILREERVRFRLPEEVRPQD